MDTVDGRSFLRKAQSLLLIEMNHAKSSKSFSFSLCTFFYFVMEFESNSAGVKQGEGMKGERGGKGNFGRNL